MRKGYGDKSMDWIKNNIFNIAITLITVVLGIGAIYASLQLRKLTSTETELTKSAEVQEVCRTIFSLKFKPTPTPTQKPTPMPSIEESIPTITTTSAIPTEATKSAIPALELSIPIATSTPTGASSF